MTLREHNLSIFLPRHPALGAGPRRSSRRPCLVRHRRDGGQGGRCERTAVRWGIGRDRLLGSKRTHRSAESELEPPPSCTSRPESSDGALRARLLRGRSGGGPLGALPQGPGPCSLNARAAAAEAHCGGNDRRKKKESWSAYHILGNNRRRRKARTRRGQGRCLVEQPLEALERLEHDVCGGGWVPRTTRSKRKKRRVGRTLRTGNSKEAIGGTLFPKLSRLNCVFGTILYQICLIPAKS